VQTTGAAGSDPGAPRGDGAPRRRRRRRTGSGGAKQAPANTPTSEE
jgi:hypothetical protein